MRAEIERRIQESQSNDPVQQRKLRLERESKRIASQLDKLLDAYQEDLIGLDDLRNRAPELRRRQAAIEKELEGVALKALEKSRLTQLNASMENFLTALRQSAKKLEVVERQKVVRLVIKQIVVNGDTLTIQHSIPISRSNESQPRASYALCTRGIDVVLRRSEETASPVRKMNRGSVCSVYFAADVLPRKSRINEAISSRSSSNAK